MAKLEEKNLNQSNKHLNGLSEPVSNVSERLIVNSLSAKSVLAGEKLVAMYSIST